MRVGVVYNPRSRANRRAAGKAWPPGVLQAAPATPQALAADLARFAGEGVSLLVIDGGDGTVREVVSALPAAYGQATPLLAVLPSGKTNILAMDLGVPRGWSLAAALAAAERGRPPQVRTPLQVARDDGGGARLCGFVFGAAGFVRATVRSHRLHRAGAFNGAAVALGLAGAALGLLLSGRHGVWARGEPLSLSIDDGPWRAGNRLVTLATTLQRLPAGLRPFGPLRPGLKLLDVDAPPPRLLPALRRLLWSEDDAWLAAHGYRRGDVRRVRLALPGAFVLDGEVYPGGDLTLSEGPPLRFLRP